MDDGLKERNHDSDHDITGIEHRTFLKKDVLFSLWEYFCIMVKE